MYPTKELTFAYIILQFGFKNGKTKTELQNVGNSTSEMKMSIKIPCTANLSSSQATRDQDNVYKQTYMQVHKIMWNNRQNIVDEYKILYL